EPAMLSARLEGGIGAGGRKTLAGATGAALVALTRLVKGSALFGSRRLFNRLWLGEPWFDNSWFDNPWFGRRRVGLDRARSRQRTGRRRCRRRHHDHRTEHWRRMAPRLQEQRVGDDGTDRGKGQRAGDHVLRAIQQDPHRKTTLGVRFNRSRAPTAPRLVVIFCNLSRHVFSPDGLGL